MRSSVVRSRLCWLAAVSAAAMRWASAGLSARSSVQRPPAGAPKTAACLTAASCAGSTAITTWACGHWRDSRRARLSGCGTSGATTISVGSGWAAGAPAAGRASPCTGGTGCADDTGAASRAGSPPGRAAPGSGGRSSTSAGSDRTAPRTRSSSAAGASPLV